MRILLFRNKEGVNFDDGSVVEFLSAKEIKSLGLELSSTCYSDYQVKDDKTYLIHSTGRVMIRVEKKESFKTTTIK